MRFFDWIARKAPQIDAPPPAAPSHIIPQPSTPQVDDGPDMLENVSGRDSVDLEPVFTVIDYVDSKDDHSRRRITLRSLKRGPNAPILMAVCHERRAIRMFRTDRIEGFIDDDGVVEDTVSFFRNTMLIDLSQMRPDPAKENAKRLRDQLRPQLSVLVAVARSDDDFHLEELDVILQFVERELPYLSGGEQVTLADLDALTPLVAKMRPSADAIPGYVEKILESSKKRLPNFRRALEQVIIADGKVRAEEVSFVEDLPYWTIEID